MVEIVKLADAFGCSIDTLFGRPPVGESGLSDWLRSKVPDLEILDGLGREAVEALIRAVKR
jgi:hypothetical protein